MDSYVRTPRYWYYTRSLFQWIFFFFHHPLLPKRLFHPPVLPLAEMRSFVLYVSNTAVPMGCFARLAVTNSIGAITENVCCFR